MRAYLAFTAAAALLALAAVAPVASSTDFCFGNGAIIYVGTGPNGPNAAYVAVDSLPPNHLFSVWTYAETNGVPGLQRGGVTLLGDADICQDYANHDRGIF